MNLDRELLRHARYLAERTPKNPQQANIRRAISASYYAVFHLLTRAAAIAFAGPDEVLVSRLARTFNHAPMAKVSKEFKSGRLPQLLVKSGGEQVPEALRRVAERFGDLQDQRHAADYDGERVYRRDEALQAVALAEAAFEDWEGIATATAARWYLMSFALWDTWNKPARS